MSENASNPLKDLWRGAQWIGWGPSLRTAIYPLRLAWYRARYGFDASNKAFARSTPQAITHLLQSLVSKDSPDVPLEVLGDVIASERLPNGIELQCTNGLCTIEAVTSRIMRVRVSARRLHARLFFLCHDPGSAGCSPRYPGKG